MLAAIFLYLFIHADASNLTVLFVLLFFAALFNFGALAIIAGPIAAEAAPLGLIASVAGLVIGVGEIFGGGVAPVIAGGIAKNYGVAVHARVRSVRPAGWTGAQPLPA